MNARDIRYVVLALVIILVLAIVVKPVITGKPLNTGISALSPTPIPTVTAHPEVTVIPTVITPVPTTPEPTPTPLPTWGGNTQSVGFVNPSQYQVNLTQYTPRQSAQNSTNQTRAMVTYATIKGKYSGTTDVIKIPFPYWELSYTIEPTIGQSGSTTTSESAIKVDVTPTRRTTNETTRKTESERPTSYSGVNPQFSITVMDYNDPNRVVRVITPPGGIDLALWKNTITYTQTTVNPLTGKTETETYDISLDPRPWTENFYEGNHSYYFIITSRYIDSYTLDIKVPKDYVGKF